VLSRQIAALEHVRDVSLIKNEHRVSSGGGVRIEAYDTAHTGGAETVAVMTVVQNGEMVKDAYRKFKIQTATNDDVAALKEVLSRRLNHSEWPLPRVFVVDGALPQLRAAERILKNAGIVIPVVGVVKNDAHKPERLIGDSKAIKAYERDILLANSEAHRFAITWHRVRRRKAAFA
jgi:excinuclease ABC subunit C